MIRIMKGDIFTTDAKAFVVPVNCVGVMGKGLAKQFREKYYHIYEEYKSECRLKRLQPGSALSYWTVEPDRIFSTTTGAGRWAILLATKYSWRNPTKLHWIIEGLKTIDGLVDKIKLTSIAIPKIGCGEGGLRWGVVKPLIFATLGTKDIEVQIYE